MWDQTLKSIEHPKYKLPSFVHTALINLFPETLRSRHLICILQYRPIRMQQSQTITYDNSSVTSTVHLFPSHHQKTCYNTHKSSYLDKHHRFPYTSVKRRPTQTNWKSKGKPTTLLHLSFISLLLGTDLLRLKGASSWVCLTTTVTLQPNNYNPSPHQPCTSPHPLPYHPPHPRPIPHLISLI